MDATATMTEAERNTAVLRRIIEEAFGKGNLGVLFEGFFEADKGLGSPMTDAAVWPEINERWDIQVVGPLLGERMRPHNQCPSVSRRVRNS